MDFLTENATVAGGVVGLAVVAGSYYFLTGDGSTASSSGASSEDQHRARSGSIEASDKYPGGKLDIFFGSQTGTSEGFARIVMEEGKERGFNAEMIDLEDFDVEDFRNKPKNAIFLMATYGEGEPTDNSHKFYNFIKPDSDEHDKAAIGDLSQMKYTVFGLGNRQYEHFNRMGKTTNSYLERLGAQRVATYGEGDDDADLEEDFEAWKAAMWPQLVAHFIGGQPASSSTTGHAPKKVALQYKTLLLTPNEAKAATKKGPIYRMNQIQNSTKHFFEPHSTMVKVEVNRELRDVSSKTAKKLAKGSSMLEVGSTRHIEIGLKGGKGSSNDMVYETADNLAIMPQNSSSSVQALAKSLGYDLSQMFSVRSTGSADEAKFKYPFPVPCTVETALSCYVDLHGAPKHSTVAALIPYITDSKQKAWLEKLCNKENSHGFKEFMSSDCKSVFSLLTSELRNCCDIPLADLLHMLPSMQPRYYTISSSSSLHPQSVHITVSVTEFATPSGGVFEGLTSGYTRYLEAGSEVRAFIRPSSFRLPKKHQTPIIMIGPGTGLAPMRALLQERRYRHAQSKSGVPGKNTLYFGCKYSDIDYIYRDELMDYSSEELTLHTAFSRETSGSKTYVQHLMQRPDDAKALVEDIVDNGAYVFVCGATAMGADVHNTLIQLFKTSKGYSQERAVAYLAELSKGGRYIQELWSA